MSFTSLELAWLVFFLGVFIPPQIDGVSGIVAAIILLLFIVVNFSWFAILVYHYELRVLGKLTYKFYTLILLSLFGGIIGLLGSYEYLPDTIWYPVSDVLRAISIGLSFLYCGYLVYASDQPLIQAKKYEYLSLLILGTGQTIHGIFHIFVHGFGVLHNIEEIRAAQESFEVYVVITLELLLFLTMAFGFSLFLLNTVKNSDYRPEINSKHMPTSQ